MCGIVGIISKKSIGKNIIEPMTDTLTHRGPDGYGCFYGKKFAFGHRRLSIVDLSQAGHQPMEYKDRYVITFNGEIYNYLDLYDELEQEGYVFKSNTDTEVILACYDFFGKDCLKKFNGMWAFVIYDKLKNKYFMSRDRFGKKPFYYYKNNDTFIFASEIKAILEHPEVKVNPNINYLNDYLNTFPKEYIKETAFMNIYRFDYSSYFEGSLEDIFGDFVKNNFWQIKPNLNIEKFNEEKAQEYANQYYKLLEDSVRIRLKADVKVGSALSGGLDSSSIVYIVNKLLKEEKKEELQETFSCVYNSDGTQYCDESYFINIIANKLNVHSSQIEPEENNIPNEIEKMIWHLENPPENSLMSSWYTFKLVSSTKVKVTLDGQGADEQLAGYLHYYMNYFSSLTLKDIFKEFWKCLLFSNAKKNVIKGFLIALFKLIFGEKILLFILRKFFKKNFELNLNKKLALDLESNLVTLIHYADHTSMAFGIESRMPFMDYRLVEFLSSVPSCYKLHNGWTKYIARLAFNNKLPDEITWRRDKMGWPIPESQWFNKNLNNWFIKNINNCRICNNLKEFNTKSDLYKNIKKLNLSLWQKLFTKD